MLKTNLLPDEIAIINNLRKSRIPMIFKEKYLDFLLIVENIHLYLTEDLLSGKKIKYNLLEDFSDLKKRVNAESLNEDDKLYFQNLIKVVNIYKKYNRN